MREEIFSMFKISHFAVHYPKHSGGNKAVTLGRKQFYYTSLFKCFDTVEGNAILTNEALGRELETFLTNGEWGRGNLPCF